MKQLWTTDEVEENRKERLDELIEAEIDDPGSIGYHELLDRTSLIMDNVHRFILSHPSCIRNKEWFSLAHQAFGNLFTLYQDIVAKHIGVEKQRIEEPADH